MRTPLTAILKARMELGEQVEPRDDFERAVVNALGDISWDEAIAAITKHRDADPTSGESR